MHENMTNDGLANGYFKVTYLTEFAAHVQTIPVKLVGTLIPGQPFGEVELKSGDTDGIAPVVDDYTDRLAAMLPPQATVAQTEVWSKPTADANPLYLYTYEVAKIGTLNLPGVRASQFTVTFRSNLGGVGRFVLLDAGLPLNRKYPITFAGLPQPFIDFAGWLVSGPSFFRARDNGYPIALLNALTKTNDKLRKKYGLT